MEMKLESEMIYGFLPGIVLDYLLDGLEFLVFGVFEKVKGGTFKGSDDCAFFFESF